MNISDSDEHIAQAAREEIARRGGETRGINAWMRSTFSIGSGRAGRITALVTGGGVTPARSYTLRYDADEDAPSLSDLVGMTGLREGWRPKAVDVWHRSGGQTRTKLVLEPEPAQPHPERLAAMLTAHAERLEGRAPQPLTIPEPDPARRFMLEVSVVDPHFGKLAHAEEAGEEYDLDVAKATWDKVLGDLLAKASLFPLERIDAVIGSDGLHVDSRENRTTSGTPQDADGIWFRAYQAYFDSYVRFIEACLTLAPEFHGRVIPGNHAGTIEVAFALNLKSYFRNVPGVHIDARPIPQKAVHYGQNLILWEHGDKANLKEFGMSLAANFSEAWGKTRYREVHTGDKHHRRRTSDFKMGDYLEHRGVIIRISPAMCKGDAWHFKKQFSGNVPGAEAYLWHRDKGLAGLFNANL